MLISQLVDEDVTNYKKCSMFIGMTKCDGKCWKEIGCDPTICQNHFLQTSSRVNISIEEIVSRYISNPLTHAIVIGGLEPLMEQDVLLELISAIREKTDDDIVIYTGYYEDEVQDFINTVFQYKNMVFKFGRYIPNRKGRYDEILGITLVSDNQYGKVFNKGDGN